MITEDYVSFEIAKLLKEKEFDEPCFQIYKNHEVFDVVESEYSILHLKDSELLPIYMNHIPVRNSFVNSVKVITAPTLQMAMKWLREIYGLMIVIHPSYPIDGIKYESLIYKLTELKDASVDEYNYNDEEYDNYEEACEAAIKYCLENLIWKTTSKN